MNVATKPSSQYRVAELWRCSPSDFVVASHHLNVCSAWFPMYSAIAAALLAQQVFTQTPCYAALVGLCSSDPPKHTMIVIPAPSLQDGRMPIAQGVPQCYRR